MYYHFSLGSRKLKRGRLPSNKSSSSQHSYFWDPRVTFLSFCRRSDLFFDPKTSRLSATPLASFGYSRDQCLPGSRKEKKISNLPLPNDPGRGCGCPLAAHKCLSLRPRLTAANTAEGKDAIWVIIYPPHTHGGKDKSNKAVRETHTLWLCTVSHVIAPLSQWHTHTRTYERSHILAWSKGGKLSLIIQTGIEKNKWRRAKGDKLATRLQLVKASKREASRTWQGRRRKNEEEDENQNLGRRREDAAHTKGRRRKKKIEKRQKGFSSNER